MTANTARNELRSALRQYTTDTFTFMHIVKNFINKHSRWILNRKKESDTIADIDVRASKIKITFSQVKSSENKGQDFRRFVKNKFKPERVESELAEMQEELSALLEVTLRGLKELDHFLDAVEKLAVTSVHVFEQNQAIQLSDGADLSSVQGCIAAAQMICPILILFKRDNEVFFSPKMQNMKVLQYQLDLYRENAQKICKAFLNSSLTDLKIPVIKIKKDISEDGIKNMLSHINMMKEIRMDKDFRMVFLFQKQHSSFMKEFSERQPQMLQFLSDVEDCAVQLDKMNKGAKISGVTGSSLGAVGGVLSILGLALIPVTAGASVALLVTGAGMGAVSGVGGIVTKATEIGVNHKQSKKAGKSFENFYEDVTVILTCLEVNPALDELSSNSTDVDTKSENLGDTTSEVEGRTVRDASRVASDVADIGQAAFRSTVAMSRVVRGGFIVANALFVGMDVFFLVRDSKSLAKGSETEYSKMLRARAALWSSEIDSWQKIYDSLEKGVVSSKRKQKLLNKAFLPTDQ